MKHSELDYGITTNFHNEFLLFEFKDPNQLFSRMRGYINDELLYTLDDDGFHIAIFQRAYILYEAWKRREISKAQYSYASLSSDNIQSRYLTDFNFFYYSKKLDRYFVCIHKDIHSNFDTPERRKMTKDIFQSLCKLHDFSAIVKDAINLFETENASNPGLWNCWDVLYENNYML